MKLFIIEFFFVLLLHRNVFLNTLFSNTLNLCSSLNARHQVSQPQKRTVTHHITHTHTHAQKYVILTACFSTATMVL